MSEMVCNFASGSINVTGGATAFGDVHNVIYQGGALNSLDNAEAATDMRSPLFLSNARGNKIDFIRVMNAMVECGMIVNAQGMPPTKKEYFLWVGKLFNIDLSNYDKDLSNSMSVGTSEEAQYRIFDVLKNRHKEKYDESLSKRYNA